MKKDLLREDLHQTAWETMPNEAVLQKLNADKNGLLKEEATTRQERFGENKLPEGERDGLSNDF